MSLGVRIRSLLSEYSFCTDVTGVLVASTKRAPGQVLGVPCSLVMTLCTFAQRALHKAADMLDESCMIPIHSALSSYYLRRFVGQLITPPDDCKGRVFRRGAPSCNCTGTEVSAAQATQAAMMRA